jgi:FixJ family two-component response regulator
MPRGQTSKVIAIIDDDESMQDSLQDLIESAGLVARSFGSAEEFLASDLHRRVACVIADIRMPKMSGVELQARLKEEECDIPIIFITAYGNARMRIQAMREGAVEFLAKPFDHCCSRRSELHLICEQRQLVATVYGAWEGASCGGLCNSCVPCGEPGRTKI